MALPVSEFIHFQLKSSVKPEDSSNEEGQALLQLFQTTKHQSGYKSSAWGRTVEDQNVIVWVVNWADAHVGIQPQILAPYIEPDTHVSVIFTTLTPSITESDSLTANPVTELVALSFPSSLTPEEQTKLGADLIKFRTALTEMLPEDQRPKSWAMAQVERPGTLEHDKSPSGLVFLLFLAVGWESVEAHEAARETGEFKRTITPIREKAIPSVPPLRMKHVSFRKI
ncbi:hypothetical protein ETB97_009507 [Aspergillus alliaceus]|uniref:ABM domain-containing protein n=1 Tax=Petromyces alliaceus TaxID=209559 RepID=A0A5N7C2M5_PETAA|nr:uncharacterized protein BDW43DRAFT_42645 [Aspergillus alliaceus]KAB8235231.1 hypothetical protein BDW43DRAFT_42645 [Aspergillus alliaceus]KAE8388103.1 hypothetical protein BDV23DRAFT_117697 [Aspergillus alliaceus]KAF5863720.1 hypothetical protein ETB97_009507 [Aspergillus burnettii]